MLFLSQSVRTKNYWACETDSFSCWYFLICQQSVHYQTTPYYHN